MDRWIVARLGVFLLVLNALAWPAQGQPEPDYLVPVRAFADTLLAHGLDRYGPAGTPLWISLIDTRDFSVPDLSAAATTKGGEGYYDDVHRRAVGGSNLYQDTETVRAFYKLSALTGVPRYAAAADAYLRAYLERAQHPTTGLLGWGEHVYYDAYADSVRVGSLPGQPSRVRYHEFLAWTPLWRELWVLDADRTRRALEALRYHFRSPQTQTYLFNRHARWDEDPEDSPYGLMTQYQYDYGQPWIKHAGLLAYSFAVLSDGTSEPMWQDWAAGVGGLYWRYRNPTTNLTPVCIDDPRPMSARASISGASMLAYWLYRAAEEQPALRPLRAYALTLFDGIATHAWDSDRQAFLTGLIELTGEPADDEPEHGIDLRFGRAAAYFAAREGAPHLTTWAVRMADAVAQAPLPEAYTPGEIGDRMHVLLDAYALTGQPRYRTEARRLADTALRTLQQGRLFVRHPGDVYYEAKDGAGSLLNALLRLHLTRDPESDPYTLTDWAY